jgi:hypothetical protein
LTADVDHLHVKKIDLLGYHYISIYIGLISVIKVELVDSLPYYCHCLTLFRNQNLRQVSVSLAWVFFGINPFVEHNPD